MKQDVETAFDDLAGFVRVIGRDRSLREWFCKLASLPPNQRASEILLMAAQMTAELKDPELVAVFRLFADARVFETGVTTPL